MVLLKSKKSERITALACQALSSMINYSFSCISPTISDILGVYKHTTCFRSLGADELLAPRVRVTQAR